MLLPLIGAIVGAASLVVDQRDGVQQTKLRIKRKLTEMMLRHDKGKQEDILWDMLSIWPEDRKQTIAFLAGTIISRARQNVINAVTTPEWELRTKPWLRHRKKPLPNYISAYFPIASDPPVSLHFSVYPSEPRITVKVSTELGVRDWEKRMANSYEESINVMLPPGSLRMDHDEGLILEKGAVALLYPALVRAMDFMESARAWYRWKPSVSEAKQGLLGATDFRTFKMVFDLIERRGLIDNPRALLQDPAVKEHAVKLAGYSPERWEHEKREHARAAMSVPPWEAPAP
jgi:hypothetical protein